MTTTVPTTSLSNLALLRGRNYFTDQEYTRDELYGLLELALSLKALYRQRPLTPYLAGRSLAMIFEQPSTRTRISFEAGMTELGGHSQYLRPGEIHLGGHESVADTARVMSRLVDAIMARTAFHSTLAELAANATVPVINGLTDDYDHPVQSMTDALTILEHFGTIEGLTCAFVGKCADAMGTSVALTMSRLGANVVMAAPPQEQMSPETEALVRANCAASGAQLTLTEDPVAAVAVAEVVYTVGWWWLQSEEEKNELRRILRPYQVNEALWSHTKPGAKFMHCLPAVRGEEMTDGILDANFSIVLDEAENRKHFQKALLLALIGIDSLPSEPELQPIARALLG
ncbi:MAG: ornithine carbamoyltransferase [Acidimicrobiales bacterium]